MIKVWMFCVMAGVFGLAPAPGLADTGRTSAPDASLRPKARVDIDIVARWDHRPGAARWTRASVTALRTHAKALPRLVPQDIDEWCPAYSGSTIAGREAFWVGLLSTLAKHESTWRPEAVGGGGLWYGLVQIYPDTARRYGCKARTGQALKDGPANLSCALRIMARTVPRDQVVARNFRGVAADWGPFHSRRKREDMKTWMRAQPYCVGLPRSLRPVARPVPDPVPDPAPVLLGAEDSTVLSSNGSAALGLVTGTELAEEANAANASGEETLVPGGEANIGVRDTPSSLSKSDEMREEETLLSGGAASLD